MLASPYLTPAQLGITRDIFNGLLRVRDELRSGELVHWRVGQPPVDHGFNMSTWHRPHARECGTVACIGGWLHTWGLIEDPRRVDPPPALRPLFIPSAGGHPDLLMFHYITPAEAADAIERWLAGDPLPYAPR